MNAQTVIVAWMIFMSVVLFCIIGVSLIMEFIENRKRDSWRNRVTADDIRELRRLFDEEGSFVAFNEKGEKLLVGYMKD